MAYIRQSEEDRYGDLIRKAKQKEQAEIRARLNSDEYKRIQARIKEKQDQEREARADLIQRGIDAVTRQEDDLARTLGRVIASTTLKD